MLVEALGYAAFGWRVVPLAGMVDGRCTCGKDCGKDAGKHPRIRKGKGGWGSSDPNQVRAWWEKWPDSNIGIATGSGLVVIDLDDSPQLAAFQQLLGGAELRTLVAQTGRGWHVYVAGDMPTSRNVGDILVRGDGSYVVAPPSRHRSGAIYRWIRQGPIAEWPEAVKKWALEGAANAHAYAKATALQAQLGQIPSYIQQTNTLSSKATLTQWTPAEEERIRSALKAIPASVQRKPWLDIGMALHSLQWERPDGSNAGFEIWDEWSSTCEAKYSRHDTETRWGSFKRSGIGIGTLFHLAGEAGWQEINGVLATVPTLVMGAEPIQFDLDRYRNPKPTCVNARRAIQRLGLVCQRDTFHDRMTVGGQPAGEWAGEVSDYTDQALRVMIHQQFGFDPGTMNTHDAIVQECLAHSFHPIRAYLDGLRWDGRPRIAQWLSTYLQADNTDLNREIGRLTLLAAVRRVRRPGAKFDPIMVLESPEGTGKSGAVEMLAGKENFSDQTILTLDDRGQQEAVQGVWLYEIADLAGKSRADLDRVKTFASRTADRARPAYGRHRVDRPRQNVFIGTTNEKMYLQSETGNRRFWGVEVGITQLDELGADRDQLWAEASYMEAQGATIDLHPRYWEPMGERQSARMVGDPWDDILRNVVGTEYLRESNLDIEQRISTRDLFEVWLKIPAHQQTNHMYKRLSYIMKRLKWEGPAIFKNKENSVVRGYKRSLP